MAAVQEKSNVLGRAAPLIYCKEFIEKYLGGALTVERSKEKEIAKWLVKKLWSYFGTIVCWHILFKSTSFDSWCSCETPPHLAIKDCLSEESMEEEADCGIPELPNYSKRNADAINESDPFNYHIRPTKRTMFSVSRSRDDSDSNSETSLSSCEEQPKKRKFDFFFPSKKRRRNNLYASDGHVSWFPLNGDFPPEHACF